MPPYPSRSLVSSYSLLIYHQSSHSPLSNTTQDSIMPLHLHHRWPGLENYYSMSREAAATAAKRRQRIFANATENNMPRNSNPRERESWPARWKNHWEKIANAEDKVHDERSRVNNRPTKPQIDKAIKVTVLGLNYLQTSLSKTGSQMSV